MKKQYLSNREKINNYIKNNVIPSLKTNGSDLDYTKLVAVICSDLMVAKKMVAEVIEDLIDAGNLTQERSINIPLQPEDFLFEKKIDKEIAEEIKEAGL